MKKYTLITGASHGIGRSMAFECALLGQNLLLIALPDQLLKDTAETLKSQFEVDIRSLAIDLCQEQAPLDVYNFCINNDLKVNILINNAGIGDSSLFELIPLIRYWQMINLNVRALTSLTYYFLPMLRGFKDARILNMSSMEATLPLPYKAVYTGTKNYIYAFSLALREELKHDNCNVKVCVVCPGPVLTNEGGLKRIKSHGSRGGLLMMMPDDVARITISKMLAGQTVINPGKMNWTIVKIMKFFPTALKMKILEKLFRVYKYFYVNPEK